MLGGLTIRGRCLLAAGAAAAICALVLDERDLLRVAAFATALPLLALGMSARARLGVDARREVSPPRLPAGERTTVRLHLSARGRLPAGGLALEDGLPHSLGRRPKFRLETVNRTAPPVLEYPVVARMRGIHRIGPLRTRVDDPLGLSEFDRELAGTSRLVVVPRVVELSGLPVGSGLGTGEDGSARLRSGHGEDDTMVRQYRHGDDIRRVHWKTTARRDELMVRAEERPWHGGVTVLLDRRSAAHRGTGPHASLEWAVSAAASIYLHVRRQGRPAHLVTEDGARLASPAAEPDTVLDSLAALRSSTHRDLVCHSDPGDGQELVAVLGEITTAAVRELTALRPEGSTSLALLLDTRAWAGLPVGGPGPDTAAQRLRAAGWSVVVVPGEQASVAAMWQQLCDEPAVPAARVPENEL
ncbi:DUF58 domain-containing protein [Saccharopolyspora sp. HNM0983]|uniref:DUF58 domain-containing protein n=1 Tax=Saccharopolyspora montiporae TaxID=2781240 RepID=A0A929FX44_9PSEU|nr:DUF58 domain-containing protein [Saccharopolyspora sp. HNM0983]MBE9374271.1 DUF58 domain-containing protein [Saccharopolyspora sp. HNM0983]